MKLKVYTLIAFLTLFILSSLIATAALPSLAAPMQSHYAYLPAIFRPFGTDVAISSLEVTQAVQKSDNSVAMVANRATVVRVFASTLKGNEPDVMVSLSATRGSSSLGTLTIGPKKIPSSPTRGDYSSTFNFLLPSAWLSGNVNIIATVDSANVLPEHDESNNILQQSLNFNDVPALNIKIVPVHYRHTPNGKLYPGQQVDISNWIRRAYPLSTVNVSFHPTGYSFTGNLDSSSEWSRLLNEVTAVKISELGSRYHPTVYYALVPISNGSSQWFLGGIAGVGWTVGGRTSVGLNIPDSWGDESAGILAAHEIGHNFGRRHAPCGVSNPDANYPYSGASIGQYGLDIDGATASLLSPNTYVDMMSYCGPEWISDYTYSALYDDQMTNGFMTMDPYAPGLLIRAIFEADDSISLKPAYAFSQAVTGSSTDSDYVLELLDANDNVIVAHGAELSIAEEPDLTVHSIQVGVPLPGKPVAKVRLLHKGVVIAEREMSQPVLLQAKPTSLTQTDGTAALAWSAPDTPSLVRYTADNGQNWITLGVDLMGGFLNVDTTMLPGKDGRFEIILADSSMPTALTAELSTP